MHIYYVKHGVVFFRCVRSVGEDCSFFRHQYRSLSVLLWSHLFCGSKSPVHPSHLAGCTQPHIHWKKNSSFECGTRSQVPTNNGELQHRPSVLLVECYVYLKSHLRCHEPSQRDPSHRVLLRTPTTRGVLTIQLVALLVDISGS